MKYRIGDVARIFGLTPGALHFFESEDIINTKKENNGYRYYDEDDIFRMLSYFKYHSMDVPLKDIGKQFSGKERDRDKVIERVRQSHDRCIQKVAYYQHLCELIALKAVKEGVCDIVSLGRPLWADPHYVNKLRAGKADDIRPCISCQEGCMGRIQEYSAINCAVNPQAARERYTAYSPIVKAKKVLIIGGGVAGCEAARVLAIRGHKPEVFEQTSKLGGNLIPGGAPDFKEDDLRLAEWYSHQLKQLNVPVTFNTKITKEFALSKDYDAVIVATGSTPKVFSLGDNTHVYTAADVLTGEKNPGQSTVVIGGGLVGCETALWLAQKGKKVTIVEALGKYSSLFEHFSSVSTQVFLHILLFRLL